MDLLKKKLKRLIEQGGQAVNSFAGDTNPNQPGRQNFITRKIPQFSQQTRQNINQGIVDLPASARILARNAPGAARQLVTQPLQAANFARQTPQFAKIKIPGLQTAANFSANTAQTVGQGVQNIAGGISDFRKPGGFNRAQAGLRTLTGVGQMAAPFTSLYQGSNLVASLPKDTSGSLFDPLQRVSAGVVRGMGQTPGLAPNVQNKPVIKFKIGDQKVEIDPFEAAGQGVGFVKNPLNKQFFNLTEKVFPAGSVLTKGNLRKWLALTGGRGAVEGTVLTAGQLPSNASDKEKAKILAQGAGTGVLAEIVGRGLLDVGGAAFRKLVTNSINRQYPKAPPETKQRMTDEYLRDPFGRYAAKLKKTFISTSGKTVDKNQPIKVTKGGETVGWMERIDDDIVDNLPPPGLSIKLKKQPNTTTSKDLDSLLQEARKYKSAEEFVKAQGDVVYHGTNYNNARAIQKEGLNPDAAISLKEGKKNIFLTGDEQYAKSYAIQKGGKNNFVLAIRKPLDTTIEQSTFKKEMKFPDLISGQKVAPEDIFIKGRDNQWYPIKEFNFFTGEPDTFIGKRPIKNIQEVTKSQLTDIWNQATSQPTKPMLKLKSNPLANEAGVKNTSILPEGLVVKPQTKIQKTIPLKTSSLADSSPYSQTDYPNSSSKSIISQSFEASPKTLEKLSIKDKLLKEKQTQKEYDEWQKILYDQTGVRTTNEAVNDIARIIRESTDNAVQNRQNKFNSAVETISKNIEQSTDKNLKGKFVTSLKTGQPISNKAGSGLERDIFEGTKNWKDKPKVAYIRERMDRNIEDIAGKDAPRVIEKYIKPVQRSEANRMRWLNKEREEIKSLGIKPKSQESKALQLFGEKKITLDNLKKQLPQTWEKVVNAEKVLRSKYDQYLTDINKVLTKNGYDPIPKRKDYFLHFQEINNVLEKYGIPVKDNTLPTDLAGATADFKPGKNFFTSALPRTGERTDFDAIQGIDRYLEGASKQIFHTDNIQNLRLFEKALRERYAGTTHLSNFTSELGEYVNNIAGKKAMIDRAAEHLVGRNIYGAAQRIRKQVGANMVGANVSSALTNYIPLTQALATTSKPSFIKGMLGSAMSPLKNDGFVDRSDFLTRRFGSDRLYMTKWDNIADKSGWLFKTIDRFVAETITRGKYHEGISKGLSPQQAIKRADDYASRLIGDRSIGSVPSLFRSETMGFLTQFQLEVNNQLSFIFKDISRSQGNKLAVASGLAQVALYSYLFNNLYESFVGRRPAFDPIGVAQNTYEDFTNPNMKKGQPVKNLVQNVSDQLPFTSVLTGGRIPVGSAIPNPYKALTGESTIAKEFAKPLTFLPPTGGGQIKKTIEGLNAFNEGASVAPSGRIRFPIEKTPANFLKSAIAGQWSTKQARDYFREGRTTLGEKQSDIFKNLPDDEKLNFYNNILQSRQQKNGVTFTPGPNNTGETGIFDKFFGGSKADATSTDGLNQIVWVDDKGNTQTVELNKTAKPKDGSFASYKQGSNALSDAVKIYHANNDQVTREQKLKAYEKLGYSEDDIRYHARAKFLNSEEQASYYADNFQEHDKLIEELIKGRVKSVGGEYLANNGALDKLYESGKISYAERKYLKSLKLDKDGNPLPGTGAGGGRGKKGKKIKFKQPTKLATVKTRSAGSGIRLKKISIPTPKLKFAKSTPRKKPRLKLAKMPKVTMKIPQSYYANA